MPGFQLSWPVNEERRSNSAFVNVRFHALESGDLATAIRSVVDHKNDKRVLRQLLPGKVLKQPSDVAVDVFDHREDSRPLINLGPGREFVAFVLWELIVGEVSLLILLIKILRDVVKWAVRAIVGQVHEERSIGGVTLINK